VEEPDAAFKRDYASCIGLRTSVEPVIATYDRRSVDARSSAMLSPTLLRGFMFAGQFALTVAARFTEAAIYITIAEQPARLELDDRSLLAEWKLAYTRGYMMQASLVVVGGVSGLVAFLTGLDWRWLLGAVVVLANWPYTIFVIMPTNNRLMNRPPDEATDETRRMIGRWGMLHAGRSALGLAATLIFLWGQR
jgi:Domain of unknown function (DUF1772)